MHRHGLTIALGTSLAATALATFAMGGPITGALSVVQSVVSSGAIEGSAGTRLRATAGQPTVGSAAGDATRIRHGYWDEIDDGVVGTGSDPAPAAVATRLIGNRPNPFNPSTTVRFDLATAGPVSIAVFDVNGRRVDMVVDEVTLAAGHHELTYQPTDLASGQYFYQLVAGDVQDVRRFTLLK